MELTVSNIIKIILGIIVVLAIIIGVSLGFKNYILPYFSGIFPSNQTDIDLEQAFYQELMKPQYLKAYVDGDGFIIDIEKGKKSNYKVIGTKGIKEEKIGWNWLEPTAANFDQGDMRVIVVDKYKKDDLLSELHNSYYLQGKFFKR